MSNSKAQISHVIFDMDGLLLDTEILYSVAQEKLLEPYGLVFTDEVKVKMMGRKELDSAKQMIEHYGLEGKMDPHDFIRDRTNILNDLFPTCDLMPGAERILLHLHKHGIPMALATASNHHHYELKKTRHTDLFNKVFDYVVTGDQVHEAKPNPEIFELASSKFGSISPDKVLVFEDSPLGVEAALRAKMKCVWVSSMFKTTESLVPDVKIDSLLEFDPEPWGLPKFED